jgi:hypothetical protein
MALVRTLSQEGLVVFRHYLAAARSGASNDPPKHILWDGAFSEPFYPSIEVEDQAFNSAFEFGTYLVNLLGSCEARELSRNHALWSWLALHFIDQIAPRAEGADRKIREDALYVLDASFVFRRYYRHLVRTPWQAVRLHGEHSKVLLLSSKSGARTEIAEQLGAYADIFSCSTIMAAAYKMWFDPATQKPRRGSGGKGAGSPRRLAAVVRQLQLTYDLADCQLSEFLKLLPKEFEMWATSPP